MAQTFSIPIEIRSTDIGIYDHVNSVVYFNNLETGRSGLNWFIQL